ncbi:hypothetical protein G6F46_007535 [Rhizopus delemar]|uniref:Myb-like domain-containing protein n=3 Tax=Rhizopus TaxID=4842 RepID=I1C5B3_RHIO9|nr:hypothetical protein RO3G_08348 [Rhizopus delemar RA 99-880]KAG1466066.1 hypothetical protein G6F55_000726 [Rhizopus delemar]KAG1541726.1 hypothetical protein G6F51_007716 [Rhizopus arrhizus]KAG1494324.1 hypothetical protein G6F54_007955 [Rhizopus delemar]KAG1518535.1 hypothetical protein G6F53_000520 [Rhizopus delemar]|eukprot:EIE83643.1 hypothetical protein RO3G_08348 [Rhizopus delemar RA 99-880]
MNVSDLLNPLTTVIKVTTANNNRTSTRPRYTSSPLLQRYQPRIEEQVVGKSRSRFSEYEDNIIRDGVAQGFTWGQISELLPHRKRATCFNRYRTLQGVRKSRKLSTDAISQPNDMIYQTKLSFSSVGENSSEISSSSSSSDDESSYSPPPMTTTTRRLHRMSLPLNNTAPLYRRHSAFHHL